MFSVVCLQITCKKVRALLTFLQIDLGHTVLRNIYFSTIQETYKKKKPPICSGRMGKDAGKVLGTSQTEEHLFLQVAKY